MVLNKTFIFKTAPLKISQALEMIKTLVSDGPQKEFQKRLQNMLKILTISVTLLPLLLNIKRALMMVKLLF